MEASREHSSLSAAEPLRLHIGGKQAKPGWKIVNIRPGPDVDFVGSCVDLSRFGDQAVDEVYASHVLEHLGYRFEFTHALQEMFRVLRPGGLLRASVPNLEVLCRIFLHPSNDARGRFRVMNMMFGGQVDENDFHKIGINAELMTMALRQTGFVDIHRVERFDLFDDSSNMKMGGVLISLNMEAKRPG